MMLFETVLMSEAFLQKSIIFLPRKVLERFMDFTIKQGQGMLPRVSKPKEKKMKSSIAFAVICATLTFASTQVLADDHYDYSKHCGTTGGFTGDVAVTSIRDALALRDDSKVVVEAKILRQTGKKSYIIADASGQAEAEISQKDFCGQSVGPDNTVRIFGEIDKELGRTIIDADYLVMIPKK